MHVTTDGQKRWLTKFTLRLIFGYAFHHKGVKRVNAVVSVKNIPIQILCLKLGFRIEATIRCGATDGGDGILFGMLDSECRWLGPKEADDGQEKRT
jgi:RimJ/RimL family protein N-acetyltransferase